MMTVKRLLLVLMLFTAVSPVWGQGGKAEPARVEFVRGSSSAVLTGTLSNGQEMDYIFSARAGQTVVIKNTRPGLFDFRVFSGSAEFETEFESSPSLTLQIPETGDYMFFVRKKQVKAPRSARFSLTLTIR